MTHPLISCVVPVYNGEEYLAETVESILAQTYSPLEIIVVDDGSTDGTAAVAHGFGGQVRYVYQPNLRQAAARNRGIDEAAGELIAFLDADDMWLPEKLSMQHAEFGRRPELGASFTYIQNFWIDELGDEAERFRGHRIAAPLPGYSGSTLVARRRAFEVVGRFDDSLLHGETHEWILRARHCGCTVDILPDVLCRRRLHQRNMSRVHQDRSRNVFLDIIKTHLDRERGK